MIFGHALAKIVQFTKQKSYVIFGHAQVKIVQFTKQKSVIRDFRARSSDIVKVFSFYAILGLHGTFRNATPCITEKGL